MADTGPDLSSRFTNPTRREWLRVGGLAPLGLSLASLLAGEAQAQGHTRKRRPARSCLLVFMEGGPSHIDLWDMKPDAPAEVRGEFQPIATSVPGLHVCEHLPLLAKQMHHVALVRSLTHSINDHNAGAYYTLTGRSPVDGSRLIIADSPKNFPPYGAVLAKLRPTGGALPDFVHVPEIMSNNSVDIAGQSAGFLGASFDPLVTGDPSLPEFQIGGLTPSGEVSVHRLLDRDGLRKQLDRSLAALQDEPTLARSEVFRQRALELISTSEVRKAFALSLEPRAVRERYGVDPGSDRSIEARKFGGLPHLGQSMLLARRLIEAGVRLVTLVTGRRIDQAWDTHRDHFPLLKTSLCPPFDRAFATLLEDLDDRGLLEETLVVCVGEFGRTPKLGQITSGAGAAQNGRDHWPYCYSALVAGAGVPGGAIHGRSDRQAAHPASDPHTPEELAATIYELMGVAADAEVRDTQGRPHAVRLAQPIAFLTAV